MAYQSILDTDMVWEAMDTRSEVGKEIDKSGIVRTEDELRATTIAPDIQYTLYMTGSSKALGFVWKSLWHFHGFGMMIPGHSR